MPTESRLHEPPLILASASPRRAELMREYGYTFTVVPPEVDEPRDFAADLSPAQAAEAVSLLKARSVSRTGRTGWILAGDTVAALGSRIFGKPADRDEARAILSALAGTTHRVITGVTLLDAADGRSITRHDTALVTMRRLSDAELEAYLDSGAWAGKAGAYGIQDRDDPFVERIDGSFTNVVGLPMELVASMLGEWGERIEPAS